MDCERKHAAEPTPARGLQPPRKMLNSIPAAVAKREAGRTVPTSPEPRRQDRNPDYTLNFM